MVNDADYALDRSEQALKLPAAMAEQSVSFINLPAEMRNRIYELALVSEQTREVTGYSESYCCSLARMRETVQQPALTHVSRSIRSETLSIFYGQNKFHIKIMHHEVVSWLAAIGMSNRLLILNCRTWCMSHPEDQDISCPLLQLEERGVQAKLEKFEIQSACSTRGWCHGTIDLRFMAENERVE